MMMLCIIKLLWIVNAVGFKPSSFLGKWLYDSNSRPNHIGFHQLSTHSRVVEFDLNQKLSFSDGISSLRSGNWVKFICGASNQDLPLIRNLCLLYSLAGVDCIDLSADPAVVAAATDGVTKAMELLKENQTVAIKRPLLMISVNDHEDLHFRKAWFDPSVCPADCARPCEKVCPAWAIPPLSDIKNNTGVFAERCYGCGRCIPICPYGLIEANSHIANRTTISDLFKTGQVQAIEIHTHHGHDRYFQELWNDIGEDILARADVIAVSFPDMSHETVPYLNRLQAIISQQPAWQSFQGVQIWQTDGRPMSGDIGKGTAHAATMFALRLLQEMIPQKQQHEGKISNSINLLNGNNFVQLAGGTNDYSMTLAKSQGLRSSIGFGGFAFGGYARKEIGNHLRRLEDLQSGTRIEQVEDEFRHCYRFAKNLVDSVKKVE